MSAKSVQSVERSFLLLEMLASARGSLGISELSVLTGLPYATIHRLLMTLVAGGYVRQERGSRKYLLGTSLVRLGDAATQDFGKWSQPLLEELAAIAGETVNLAMLQDDEVVYMAQAQSRHRVRMFTEPGSRAPAHATGVGKALLAYRSRHDVEALIDRRGLVARTVHTIVSREKFFEELDRVVRRGYSVDNEEVELGVCCIAVPVRPDSEGLPLAAISVSGPTGRLTRAQQKTILPDMWRIAAEIGAEAGADADHA